MNVYAASQDFMKEILGIHNINYDKLISAGDRNGKMVNKITNINYNK
jgi:hypothetical protein